MPSYNKVILMGNLGKDPELRYTPSQQAVCQFPIATTDSWTDREGNRQEKTEWHNIVVFGRQAETTNQYVKKGRPVFIEGRISNRSWDDQDGNKRYRTEIIANRVLFLGSSGQNSSGGSIPLPEMSPADSSDDTTPGEKQFDNDSANTVQESDDTDDLPF